MTDVGLACTDRIGSRRLGAGLTRTVQDTLALGSCFRFANNSSAMDARSVCRVTETTRILFGYELQSQVRSKPSKQRAIRMLSG